MKGKGKGKGKGAGGRGSAGRGASAGSGRSAAGSGKGAIAAYIEDNNAYGLDGAYIATLAGEPTTSSTRRSMRTSKRTPRC